MKVDRNSPEQLLKQIVKLNDAVQFIGICKILGVDIYTYAQEDVEGGQPSELAMSDSNAHKHGSAPSTVTPKDFTDIWSEVCDAVEHLNYTQRRNLGKLLRAALKGEK